MCRKEVHNLKRKDTVSGLEKGESAELSPKDWKSIDNFHGGFLYP